MYILSIFRIVLFIFTTAVMIHGRQVEIASSLDFLWKQQAKKELEEMSEMRRHTNQLLQNILPIHVAKYFLEQDRQAEVNRVFFLEIYLLIFDYASLILFLFRLDYLLTTVINK